MRSSPRVLLLTAALTRPLAVCLCLVPARRWPRPGCRCCWAPRYCCTRAWYTSCLRSRASLARWLARAGDPPSSRSDSLAMLRSPALPRHASVYASALSRPRCTRATHCGALTRGHSARSAQDQLFFYKDEKETNWAWARPTIHTRQRAARQGQGRPRALQQPHARAPAHACSQTTKKYTLRPKLPVTEGPRRRRHRPARLCRRGPHANEPQTRAPSRRAPQSRPPPKRSGRTAA